MIDDATVWNPPPHICSVRENEAHIWRIDLESQHSWAPKLIFLLSDDEQSTAERFRFLRDRDRYIVSHGALRLILGQYLQYDLRDIQFHHNAFGKPHVGEGEASVHFNLSHTDGLALVAVAHSFAVGVDVERRQLERFDLAIARRFFSPSEYTALLEMPAYRQIDGFFQCWVRKEAFIKARGTGLSFPLHQFDVSVAVDRPAELLAVRGIDERVEDWSLLDIALQTPFAAALAARAPHITVRCWQWHPSPDLGALQK
jgi:4'-phosphopantetheinyl transferase